MNEGYPNKKLGQHWLHDMASLEMITAAGGVADGDNVLEIGPGLGTLTDVLISKEANITAGKYDSALAESLTKKYAAEPKVKVISQDIRRFNFNDLPTNYKIVANIPYYLTSVLLRLISETDNPPYIAVLLVQKEVAERVCAG